MWLLIGMNGRGAMPKKPSAVLPPAFDYIRRESGALFSVDLMIVSSAYRAILRRYPCSVVPSL